MKPSKEKTEKPKQLPAAPTKEEEVEFLQINELELEKAWADQPRLCWRWNRKLAKAKKQVSNAEKKFELVKAKLGKNIRENPEAYKLRKNTNDAVSEVLICQDLYQEAYNEIIEAQYEVDLIKAVTAAINDKKYALQDLVQLYLNEYYAEPSKKGHNKEAIDEMEQRAIAKRGQKRRDE